MPTASTPNEARATARRRNRLTWLLAIVVLAPSMYGFVGKFVEFIHVFRGDAGGAFAVAPMLNYFLASAGFLMMLLWAACNGMFTDMERPKHSMLENEALLDGDELPRTFRATR